MSGQTFSTFTEVGMIDARLQAGAITLPTTTSIPYRILTLKDVYGATTQSTVTIQTQAGDTFEDGTTSRALNASWASMSLYAGVPGIWYTIGGSVLTSASISSLTVSSIYGLQGFVSTPYLETQVGSTVVGLGTAGYISSSQLLSTSLGLSQYISSFIDPTELTSTVVGLGTQGFVSSLGLTYAVASTAQGLGTFGYTSTSQLLSTSLGLYQQMQASVTALVQADLTSTVIGLGTVGYLSTVTLGSLVSTANLATFVSTSYLATQLGSTVIGLGSAGYISSSQLLSTSYGLSLLTGVTTSQLGSTVRGLGTAGYLSTSTAFNGSTLALSSGSITANSLQVFSYINMTGGNLSNIATEYFTTPKYTTTFLPTSLSGLKVWFDASQTTSILSNGSGQVGTWSNLATGYAHATQATTANQPYTGRYLVNNLNTMQFNNLQGLTFGSINWALATQCVVAVLYTPINPYSSGGNNWIFGGGNDRNGTQSFIGYEYGGSGFEFGTSVGNTYGLFGYIPGATLVSQNTFAGNPWVLSVHKGSVTNGIYINGTSNVPGCNFATGSFSDKMGGSIDSGGNTFYICEYIHYDADLSLAQKQIIEGYLAWKWGTQTTLNITHPYYSVPPPPLGTVYIASGNIGSDANSNLTIQATTTSKISVAGNTQITGSLTVSTIAFSTISGTYANISSISTQALIVSSINGFQLLTTSNLTSTVVGLGSAGYVSSSQLVGHVSTANLANLVSSANLATLVSTTYLATQLGSTVVGLGTAGYISSSQLLSTSLGLSQYISSFIDPTELTSTVVGLGTQGFVSSLGLTYAVASTAQGLGTFGYTSTSQLLSTSLGLYQAIQNSPTALVQANLTSTVIGLGTVGYISSAQLLSTTYGYSQNFITQNQSVSSLRFSTTTGNNAYISSLTIDQLIFGDGNGWADFAVLRAVAVSTLQINTGIIYATTVSTTQIIGVNFLSQANLTSTVIGLGTVGYISSQTVANLVNLVSTANLADLVSTTYLATQLGSTVVGLGTAGYISSSQLLSTSLGLSQYISSFIDPTELTSTVIGLGTQGFVSSLGLTYAVASTAQGLGTFGYTSTSQLLSTSLGLYQQIQTSPTNITQTNLTSTITGLGTFGYLSTVALGSVVSTANLANHVSTANLANLVSTTYLATQLGSTVIGLGSAGYLSTGFSTLISQAFITSSLSTTNINTANINSLTATISSLTVNALFIGTGTGFTDTGDTIGTSMSTITITANTITAITLSTQQLNVSSITGISFLSQTNLTSTVIGLGTAGYLSSATNATIPNGLISTANLTNLVSTANLANLISTANLANLVSTANLATLVSTTYLATQLGSTVLGLGTAGYISSSQLLSTSLGLSQYISSFIDPTELTSTVVGLGTQGFVSSLGLTYAVASTAQGLGTFGYTSTSQLLSTSLGLYQAIQNSPTALVQANLTSTVIGLGTVGYLSTVTLGSLVSTANLVDVVSTANLANLVSTTYLATQLGSTVIGLGTVGYLSSIPSLGGFVSTANLANLVSTTYLATQIGSTVIGLGTAGYLSSIPSIGGFVSTANLATLVSTSYLATQLGSTVRGLGTAGYISSINYSTVVLSSLTAQNINSVQGYISSLVVDSLQLGSNTAYIYMGDVIATSLSTVYVAAGSATILSISAQQLYVSSIQATNIIGALTTTNLTSTVVGLGTAGYISSSQLLSTSLGLTQYMSSFIDPTELTSTVVGLGTQGFVSSLGLTYAVASTAQGLGTFGYTSTSQLLSTSLGLYQQIQTSATTLVQADLTSTITGLGTFGYISTLALGSLVSTANLVGLVSTANLANLVSTANLATLVSTTYLATQLGSTVRGLGTAGYLSSINYSTVSISSLSTQYINSVQGYISSLTVDSFFLGSNSAFFNMGDVIATSLSTIQINVGVQYAITISAQQLFVSSIQATNIIGALQTASLTSTVVGLGTAGYISSSQLLSTSLGLSQYISSFIDPTELTSTVVGLGTQGFVSSLGLTYAVASTAQGLGTFGYTSTSQLLSTSLGLYQQIQTSPTNITQTNLTSTIIGLGTVGYLSTVVLANLVSTANLANLVSTANLAGHISTANLANLISTTYLSTQLGSTFATLNVSSLSTFSLQGTTAFISSLTVNALFIGSNQGFVNMGDVIATSVSTLQIYAGGVFTTSNQANILSTQQLNVSSITGITFLSQTALTSTVIGLGTTGYISSSQLLSTSLGLSQYISSFIDPTELTSTVVGLGTQGFVSSLGLTYAVASTAQGLGTFGYTSTSQLLSTSLGLYQQIQTSPTNITQTNLTSTIIGLGTFGYLSTVALGSLVSTANLANHISTANLANFVSTTYLSTQLGSTFAVLNVSSLSTFSFTGTTGFISTLTVNNLYIGSNQGFTTMGDVIGTSISTILLYTGVEYATNIYASSLAVSSIQSYSNQVNILSAQQLNVSSITGITFLSQTALTSTVIGLGTVGYLSSATASVLPGGLVSTANLATLVSTSYLATQLGSTVIGLGTAGYISSSQLLSTSLGLSEYISSFIDPTELTSTVVGLGTQGFVSSLGLTYAVASTAQGLGTFGYTSTSQLLSTSLGLYQEMQISVTFFVDYSITSTITGLGTFGYLSTVILDSLVSTANLTNLVSTANLVGLVSTANLADLVSTSFFDKALTSTVIGLGTVGYLSSATAATLPEGLISTANLAGLVSTANLEGLDFYLGTQIGSTVIGLGTAGYLSSATAGVLPGDLVSTSYLSTQLGSTFSVLNVSTFSTFSLSGTTAFISSLTVYNLNIGFDPGYVNMGDMIATSLSSVLVTTNYIFATSNQSIFLSTQQLNISSINGQTFGGPIVSTVIGLGTAGYISTATLLSTSAGLGSQIAAGGGGGITTNNLTSTVIGLGTAGYLSTATLLSTSAGLTTQIAAGGSLTGPRVSTQQLLASSIGILTAAPSFPLDVFGASRTGMPVSSLCNIAASIGLTGFGIFYYITNSGFNSLVLPATDPAFSGWFVTLRNNTGSYLSVTITGTNSKIPASPFSMPPANSVSLAYDTNPPSGGCNWVYF